MKEGPDVREIEVQCGRCRVALVEEVDQARCPGCGVTASLNEVKRRAEQEGQRMVEREMNKMLDNVFGKNRTIDIGGKL